MTSRRRHNPSVGVGAALGSTVMASALVVGALLLPATESTHSARPSVAVDAHVAAHRVSLARWEAAVQPLVVSAGQVVALGPRTSRADFERHQFDAATLQRMADGWVRRLSQLADQLDATPAPDLVQPMRTLLGQAMRGYVTAARRFQDAASATGARQRRLLDAASAAGKAADKTYDLAVARIAQARAQLSLPTDWSG